MEHRCGRPRTLCFELRKPTQLPLSRRRSGTKGACMKPLLFFADDSHPLLVDASLVSSMSQIGPDGQNLTITFLSLNRSVLSIRLIQSIIREIPQYAGRILITDNGSDPDELRRLEHFVATKCHFPTRIIKLDSNYGVA